uniref:Uncharacterized protein n=1 Tax=Rousettus aegyptiacus TaxID=9407 RepID=A0A7J8FJ28_ROUAE|nr:hypothetical protein HJG63_011900 [Rousettus aegyptiacus]
MALSQGLWSSDEGNSLGSVMQELKNPQRNLVWALMFSVSIVTGLYIPVNISYLLALSPNEILSSDTKAVSWGSLCPLQVCTVMPAIVLRASLCPVLAPIINHPRIEFLYILLSLLSGFLVCFRFVHFQHQPKCLRMAVLHLQLLLEDAPTTKNVD